MEGVSQLQGTQREGYKSIYGSLLLTLFEYTHLSLPVSNGANFVLFFSSIVVPMCYRRETTHVEILVHLVESDTE